MFNLAGTPSAWTVCYRRMGFFNIFFSVITVSPAVVRTDMMATVINLIYQ